MTTTTKLLYAPTQRTSQPNSILTPISTYELHLIQSSANPLRTIINPVGIAPTTTAPAATTAAHSSLPSRPSATTNSNRKRSYDDPSSTTTAYAQEDDTNKRFKSLNGYNDVNVVAKHCTFSLPCSFSPSLSFLLLWLTAHFQYHARQTMPVPTSTSKIVTNPPSSD